MASIVTAHSLKQSRHLALFQIKLNNKCNTCNELDSPLFLTPMFNRAQVLAVNGKTFTLSTVHKYSLRDKKVIF